MSEHIVYIPEDMSDHDELFVGNLRKDKELIRCEDCKWWKAEKQECYEWYDSPYAPADGYCFRAERKEE